MPRLIYPERREISEEAVIQWAHDLRVTAAMNGETAGGGWVSVSQKTEHHDGALLHTVITTVVKAPSFEEAVAELSDAGVATFQRGTV